jgi:hypothetical protein
VIQGTIVCAFNQQGLVNRENKNSRVDSNDNVAIHWILETILEDLYKSLMKPLQFM